MKEFFNTYLNPLKIYESKREWRAQMARVKALPSDYEYVYGKIMHYLFNYGIDDMKILYDLIDLFESGVAEGKDVLDITGEDVAAFCDEILRNAKPYTEKWRSDMNRDIHNKLGVRRSDD